jgi:glycosyltransferase involved in cell wall biosynthesis
VNDAPPFVSVIIPVRDDRQLAKCLRALEDQTYPKSAYEVIVVDNGSNESVDPVVAGFGQAQTVREGRSGSYAARNRGLTLARGEVIAFTDSDCIPDPGWIEMGVARLLGTLNCGLIAGRVESFFEDPLRPTAVELYESVTAFPQKRYVEVRRFGATANLFTFKSVFEDVGPFDDELRSGGDYEWGRRVFASGYGQVYADDVRVAHPARRSFGQLRGKIVRVADGHRSNPKYADSSRLIGELLVLLLPPVRVAFRIFLDKSLGGIGTRAKVVLVMCLVRYLQVWERLRVRLLRGKLGG